MNWIYRELLISRTEYPFQGHDLPIVISPNLCLTLDNYKSSKLLEKLVAKGAFLKQFFPISPKVSEVN